MFPYEYQRALRLLTEESTSEKVLNGVNGVSHLSGSGDTKIKDIEDAILDKELEKKKVEKILDKKK